MNITKAAAVLKAHGLSLDSWNVGGDGSWDIHTPEVSFYEDEDGVEVLIWTGSHPFAVEHPMGVLPTVEEAVRYAVWLLKREDFYNERDEALWRDLGEES